MDGEHESWRPGTVGEMGGVLRARREELGMTLEGLAGVTGISKPYLSNIETGRLVGPASEEKLRVIARALGMEQEQVVMAGDWLRTPLAIRELVERREDGMGGVGTVPRRGDGAIDLDAVLGSTRGDNVKLDTRHSKPVEGVMGPRRVPLINKVAAGKPSEFGDLDYPRGVGDAYVEGVEEGEGVGCLFALRVSGDSMMPEYQEGDVVFVGGGDAADGDDCVVRMGETHGWATTFKRVYFVRGADGEATGVRLVPLNRAYAEWTVSLEEVSGVYPVIYRLVPARKGRSEGAGGRGEGKDAERPFLRGEGLD